MTAAAEHKVAEPKYSIETIVHCMRISAAMLVLAENANGKNYRGQAKLLYAAADDLELRA